MAQDDDRMKRLDALLAETQPTRWDRFYVDRAKPCPFFVDAPDENLVEWIDRGLIEPGRAFDLGCGHGRNSVLLASRGHAIDAVDYSATALAWAAERIRDAGARVTPGVTPGVALQITLRVQSVFDLAITPASCDLVYDSGCFHHIAPHRRAQYVALVVDALKPGGCFGLTCFRPEGGSGYADDEVYARRSMGGGLGYSEDQLRDVWSAAGLDILELRPMHEQPPGGALFGKTFLWAMLARKR